MAEECDRTSTHENRQMCETDLSCRELAHAWKLLSIVLNSALSYGCCVVPPEAFASHARRLDETVDTVLPLFTGTDALDDTTRMCMRLRGRICRLEVNDDPEVEDARPEEVGLATDGQLTVLDFKKRETHLAWVEFRSRLLVARDVFGCVGPV